MLSRALIVCLLALFCLQITGANRLDTRIASPFISTRGQFPYIVSLQYTSAGTTYQSTGIIYSKDTVVTSANVFNNFPPTTGAVLTIGAGAYDLTQAAQVISFPAMIGKYGLVPNGTAPPPPPPGVQIYVPTSFTPGSSSYDIAVIRIPTTATPNSLDLANPEIKLANFPTSSPIPSETIFAVAYGNQGAGSPVFPLLKYARIRLQQNNRCMQGLSSNNITVAFNASQNFCVASQLAPQTNGTFNGVCASDIGGAIVRDGDITNQTDYSEVIGLISYAGDNTTCNPAKPAPVIVTYLSYFYNTFISPLAGTPAQFDITKNPNHAKGNFICGNNVVEGPYEKCEGTANKCCNPWTCAFRPGGYFCGTRPKNGTAPNKCLTRPQCNGNQINGACIQTPKKGKKPCAGKGTRCIQGVCNKCSLGTCAPVNATA